MTSWFAAGPLRLSAHIPQAQGPYAHRVCVSGLRASAAFCSCSVFSTLQNYRCNAHHTSLVKLDAWAAAARSLPPAPCACHGLTGMPARCCPLPAAHCATPLHLCRQNTPPPGPNTSNPNNMTLTIRPGWRSEAGRGRRIMGVHHGPDWMLMLAWMETAADTPAAATVASVARALRPWRPVHLQHFSQIASGALRSGIGCHFSTFSAAPWLLSTRPSLPRPPTRKSQGSGRTSSGSSSWYATCIERREKKND